MYNPYNYKIITLKILDLYLEDMFIDEDTEIPETEKVRYQW